MCASVCRGLNLSGRIMKTKTMDKNNGDCEEDEQRPQNYQKEIKSIALGIKTALRILQKESLEDYF